MKRSAIDINKKQEICKFKKCNPSFTRQQQSDKFNIPRTSIRDILKKKSVYLDIKTTSNFKRQKFPQNIQLEEALFEWFAQKRAQNIVITDDILCTKAKELGTKLCVSDTFQYSSGWLQRFKKRKGIQQYSLSGESASVSMTDVNIAIVKMREICKSYDGKNIFNCDETGLYFRMMPDKTLALKDEDHKGTKKNKSRITVMIGCNADGSEKLKLLIIGKNKSPRSFKNFNTDIYCTYRWNKSAWMTTSIFEEFTKSLNSRMASQNRKILLLVDNATSHQQHNLSHVNIQFFPPNMTSHLQPCDAGIIKAFKCHYRKQLLRQMIFLADNENHTSITVADAIRFCHYAWNNISQSTIMNSWKHVGLQLHDSENKEMVENITIDRNIFEQIRAAFNIDDLMSSNEFVDVDHYISTEGTWNDDDLIENVRNTNVQETETSEDEEVVSSTKKVSGLAARKALKQLSLFFEQSDDANEADTQLLHAIEMRVNFISENSLKQKPITDFFKSA